MAGVGAGVGYLVANLFLGGGSGARSSGGDPLGAWGVATLVAGALPGFLGVLLVHELGHVTAGLAVRFRFFLLVIGPLKITRGEDGLEFGWNTSLALAGGLAGTAPVSGDLEHLRRRMAFMVAGGPLASLALGGLGLAAHTGLGLGSAEGAVARAGAALLLILAVASLAIGVVTLIPGRTSGFLTDGARLLQILRGGPRADADLAIVTIVAWSMSGLRPREWTPEILERALRAPDGSFRALAVHSAWRHAVDSGDGQRSGRLQAELIASVGDLPAAVRPGILLEVATERALGGDVEGARELVEAAGTPGPLVDRHAAPLARAAIALGEGRLDASAREADEARRLLPRSNDAVAVAMDRERLERIRAGLSHAS